MSINFYRNGLSPDFNDYESHNEEKPFWIKQDTKLSHENAEFSESRDLNDSVLVKIIMKQKDGDDTNYVDTDEDNNIAEISKNDSDFESLVDSQRE